jgi:hypothetical protein
MTWPELTRAASARVADPSLIRALTRLGEALAALDVVNPDTDSIAYDTATDRLITTARHLVTTASPVMAALGALQEAVQDAIAERRDLTGWCRACDLDESGLCGDHSADLAQADVYETLLPALAHGRPIPPAPREG